MKLSLGFSPCPNDTFIFDAIVNRKIDCGELEFEPILEDVETLNRWSFEGKLDISKLSYPAYFQNLDKYILLNSGAALGKGVGPLLISKTKEINKPINDATIVLPGENTTANLLFSFAYPDAKNKKFRIFSEIEDTVLNEETDLGVIIHENRFTYQQRGLYKVTDLGEFWEEKMNAPIPLGGIVIRRNINQSTCNLVDSLIKKSIIYSFKNYPHISEYIKMHSQEMQESVMRHHIDLYVNNYSLNLGIEGKNAIQTLFSSFHQLTNAKSSTTSSRLFHL